jgi:hypothetical protein
VSRTSTASTRLRSRIHPVDSSPSMPGLSNKDSEIYWHASSAARRRKPSMQPRPNPRALKRSNRVNGEWRPRDVQNLIITTTGCLCLLILVLGLLILTYLGKLSPGLLGSIKGIGTGLGFLGLASVLLQTIKIPLSPRRQHG